MLTDGRMSTFRAFIAALALAGCVGEIGEGNPAAQVTADFEPAAPALQRLTQVQLQNSYRSLLGEPLDVPSDLPADDQLYGFTSIAAASKTIALVDAEKYEAAAYDVLGQVWQDPSRRDALVGCAPGSVQEPCVRAFLETFASRAWRRPALPEEVDALTALGAQLAVELGDPSQALEFTLAAVLQSPHFLFRVEIGEPSAEHLGLSRYTSWEMASRLSFLITDSPPDDTLVDVALSGGLTDEASVRAEAERLLDDPRARPAMVRFFRDFMNIRGLDALDKSPEVFPAFSATLGPAMRTEIERMFESVVFEKQGDFRQVFTTRETYLNEELARVYGISGVTGPDFVPYTLPDDGLRGGILSSAGFLALNAHKTQTSPTRRGRFMRINLLCEDVPPPPPGIDTTLPETPAGQAPKTLRQRLAAHVENPTCAACHDQMDPLGFAFESYDSLGQFRTVDENGLPLDTSAEVDGEPIATAAEMSEFIGALPQVGDCIARRFYEHAGAHLARTGEELAVEALVEEFAVSNYDFKALVVAMVTNDGYRYAVPTDPEE